MDHTEKVSHWVYSDEATYQVAVQKCRNLAEVGHDADEIVREIALWLEQKHRNEAARLQSGSWWIMDAMAVYLANVDFPAIAEHYRDEAEAAVKAVKEE